MNTFYWISVGKYSDTIGVDAPTLIAIRYVLLLIAYVHGIII